MIWAEYKVAAPVWVYVYDIARHSLADPTGPAPLASFIEPEIVFGLALAPKADMDERTLLGCVGWVALGFEAVQSLFPGWRFHALDTVAAFGLHSALYMGEPVAVPPPRLRPRGLKHLAISRSSFAAMACSLTLEGNIQEVADAIVGGMIAMMHRGSGVLRDGALADVAMGAIES